MQITVNLYFNKMMKKVYHSSSDIIYVDKPFRKQTPKPTDFEHLFFQADKRFLEKLSLKSIKIYHSLLSLLSCRTAGRQITKES